MVKVINPTEDDGCEILWTTLAGCSLQQPVSHSKTSPTSASWLVPPPDFNPLTPRLVRSVEPKKLKEKAARFSEPPFLTNLTTTTITPKPIYYCAAIVQMHQPTLIGHRGSVVM